MSNLQSSASKAQMIELLNSIKIPVLGAGGGFAPIGTENYVDGSTAPQGWLICDGSTHNIADYPELAAYIASHHGASNYYGGDGVTTFAVPKRSGMPNGGEILSGTEKVIGIDENRKPVYAQFVDFGSGITIPTDSWYCTSINSSSMDRIIYAGASRAGNNSGLYISLLASTNANTKVELKAATSNSDMRYLYLKYTKTNDTAVPLGHSSDGNGVFCIKATVAGDPNGEVYSTEETICGTWVDGKSLFVKVFTGLNAQIPANNWNDTVVSVSDLNIDTLVDCICLRNSSGSRSDTIYIPQEIGSDNGYINIYGNSRARTITTIIIRYTKTQS